MTCAECRDRLLELPIDAIERELGPHLASCDGCRRLADAVIAEEQALYAALDAWLDAPVEDAVQAALSAQPPARRRLVMLENLHAVAIAAALAAAVLLGLRVDGGGADAPPDLSTTTSPAEDLTALERRLSEIAALDWHERTEKEWGAIAEELRQGYVALRARPEAPARRALEFDLLVQMGRAAENANDSVAPYYQQVDGMQVSVPWYLVAVHLTDDPTLDARIRGSARDAIHYYLQAIEQGKVAIRPVDLSR